MFLGLRTAAYYVSDIAKARDWYASVLGFGPYSTSPFMLVSMWLDMNSACNPAMPKPARPKVLWLTGVWTMRRRRSSICWKKARRRNEDVQDVGGDIKVATVKDPFGNIFGVIQNPNFKL